MLYLLDANILIDAEEDYYPLERIPEFWEWLIYHGKQGNIKIPIEIYEEFSGGEGKLAIWSKQPEVKDALLLNEQASPDFVNHVTSRGYADDLTDIETIKIGRDPFLISYALKDLENRCIVTSEVSGSSKKRANRRIPDVCADFNIRCIKSFQIREELDFRTDWKKTVIS